MNLTALPTLPDLSIGSAVGAAVDAATAAATVGHDPATETVPSLTKYVIILLGLLLIAAGIFSFDKTKELIVAGGKAAAKTAGTAAAVA